MIAPALKECCRRCAGILAVLSAWFLAIDIALGVSLAAVDIAVTKWISVHFPVYSRSDEAVPIT